MGQPEQGEPECRMVIGEGPFQALPIEPLLDVFIFGKEKMVVVFKKFVMPNLAINSNNRNSYDNYQEYAGSA
jgi:hypothetical protein